MDDFKKMWEDAMKKAQLDFNNNKNLDDFNDGDELEVPEKSLDLITSLCYQIYLSFLKKGFTRDEALILTMKLMEIVGGFALNNNK